jgi:purine-nucleoside phosphorylase
MYEQIEEAVTFLNVKKLNFIPRYGIILGTGLGSLEEQIDEVCSIAYADIPHFAQSTVVGHAGKLIFGYLAGVPIVAMAGRFHYYEGYTMSEVTFPIRVLQFLGIEQLIISNAAGGVKEHLYPGDIVFIRDHINLHASNPLRGANDERLGVRFPDMLQTYSRDWNQKALSIAEEKGIRAFEGVYVGTQGPNLETAAEYNFFNIIGGDVVGMSTIPEVLVARHMNLPVFVVSVVSNRCFPIEELTETTLEEVIAVVGEVTPKMTAIITELVLFFANKK